jgi:hypothetical protein
MQILTAMQSPMEAFSTGKQVNDHHRCGPKWEPCFHADLGTGAVPIGSCIFMQPTDHGNKTGQRIHYPYPIGILLSISPFWLVFSIYMTGWVVVGRPDTL